MGGSTRFRLRFEQSNATQRIVEIVLESDPETETYNVHENLLREASTYLNEYLQKLEKAKPLIIRNVRRDTFDTFCSWLYTRKVEIEDITEITSRVTGGKRFVHLANLLDVNSDPEQSIDEKSHGHKAADRVYERLVSCYIFAHEFQARTFQNAIIQQLQRFQRGLRGLKANERILPCLSVVNTAVTSTGGGSAISRWFAASFGTHGHEENLCNELELASGGLHFLAAVLKFIYADRKDKYNQDPMLTQNWCKFHEHDDKAARYACYIAQLEWDNPSDEKVLKWKARG